MNMDKKIFSGILRLPKGVITIEQKQKQTSDTILNWEHIHFYTRHVWIHAEITKLTINENEPFRKEPFTTFAIILVRMRVQNQRSDEIIEKSFEAQIGFDDSHDSYFFLYHPPYKRKPIFGYIRGIYCDQTFGHAISLLKNSLIHTLPELSERFKC